ncbi:hypothetical protein SDC9_158298 [bioreactor metagenome]|uniref:Uncharacterized protein n=1 Tax=bioreactor metagenome TaxID=1076179 RepID=A0A645FAR4_9ZZZZ
MRQNNDSSRTVYNINNGQGVWLFTFHTVFRRVADHQLGVTPGFGIAFLCHEVKDDFFLHIFRLSRDIIVIEHFLPADGKAFLCQQFGQPSVGINLTLNNDPVHGQNFRA